MGIGRPSDYNDDIAKLICSRMAAGKSIRQICQADDMPHVSTVFSWLSTNQLFAEQYTRARSSMLETWAETIVDLADNAEDTSEGVNKARLQIDTRKWIMSKLLPRTYGEKPTTLTINNNSDNRRVDVTLEALKLASPDILASAKRQIIEANQTPVKHPIDSTDSKEP